MMRDIDLESSFDKKKEIGAEEMHGRYDSQYWAEIEGLFENKTKLDYLKLDQGDYVLIRAREFRDETGAGLIEAVTAVLNVCVDHGTNWLSDDNITFPWFQEYEQTIDN